MVLSFVINVVGLAFELATVLLLLRRGLWRVYAFFFAYAIWLFTANSAIFVTDLYFRRIYFGVYWHIDTIDIVLRLLVVWEVFRQTFPKDSGLNRSLSKGLGIVALGLLVLASAMFWGYQNHSGHVMAVAPGESPVTYDALLRSLHLALDRSFGFVQAVMILGVLAVARYYGVRYGRNIGGIAYAFGAWASISTANNAMVDLTNSLRPFGFYLRPLSFVLMLVVWIWALWVYAPNPPIKESEAVELDRWTEDWNRTISTARTILRP